MILRLIVFFSVIVFNAFSGIVASQILPSSDRFIRLLTAGGDAVLIGLCLTALYRNRTFYGVRLVGVFALGAVISIVYGLDNLGLVGQLNGIRLPFVFFSVLILTYDFMRSPRRGQFVFWFTGFLIVFAIAQFPASLQQNLKYGAGDEVGGTYGTTGGSGYVSQGLFLIVFYLLARYGSRDEGRTFRISYVVLLLLLLVPCVLNETKISFILFAGMMTLLLVEARVPRLIAFVVLGVGGLFGLYTLYNELIGKFDIFLDQKVLEKYLFHDSTRNIDIPRFQKILLMMDVLQKDILSMFVGLGYGLFSGGKVLDTNRLSRSLSYFGGSRGLIVVVWLQGGLIALASFAGVLYGYLKTVKSLLPVERRLAYFVAFSVSVIWVYNEAVLDRTYGAILAFLMMWLYAGGRLAEDGETAPPSTDPASIDETHDEEAPDH
jgi:hypothetical protein